MRCRRFSLAGFLSILTVGVVSCSDEGAGSDSGEATGGSENEGMTITGGTVSSGGEGPSGGSSEGSGGETAHGTGGDRTGAGTLEFVPWTGSWAAQTLANSEFYVFGIDSGIDDQGNITTAWASSDFAGEGTKRTEVATWSTNGDVSTPEEVLAVSDPNVGVLFDPDGNLMVTVSGDYAYRAAGEDWVSGSSPTGTAFLQAGTTFAIWRDTSEVSTFDGGSWTTGDPVFSASSGTSHMGMANMGSAWYALVAAGIASFSEGSWGSVTEDFPLGGVDGFVPVEGKLIVYSGGSSIEVASYDPAGGWGDPESFALDESTFGKLVAVENGEGEIVFAWDETLATYSPGAGLEIIYELENLTTPRLVRGADGGVLAVWADTSLNSDVGTYAMLHTPGVGWTEPQMLTSAIGYREALALPDGSFAVVVLDGQGTRKVTGHRYTPAL